MNIKDKFIQEEVKNESTKKSYYVLFNNVRILERELDKDIEFFKTKNEFKILLEHCCKSTTYNAVSVKWSLLKKYFSYIGNNNINKITKMDLRKAIAKVKEVGEDRYIAKEELISKIGILENSSDKCMLMLLRNGIGADYEVSDLINITKDDIDLKHKTINNVKIDDYTCYLVERTLQEREYISIGSYDKIIVYNSSSPYLFKTRPTKLTNDGLEPLKPSGVRGRLQKIRELLKDDRIVLSNLVLSHAIDKIIEYQQNIGKELSQRELSEFLEDNFGKTKNIYDIKYMAEKCKNKVLN